MSRRAAVLLAVAGAFSCHAQEDAFYARIFPCDYAAGAKPCGTTRDGKPMTCFGAGQLGGQDFCTETCDPKQPQTDSRLVCLASGALLHACHPHAGASDPALGCPEGLHCYRTDLLQDQGVCIDMQVCTENADCNGTTCAATLIRDLGSPIPLNADNLQCVQRMCASGDSMCPPRQVCLASYYSALGGLRDLCVPTCDGDNSCPPNYACAVTPASQGAPSACLPGVPGVRCERDQDCVVGTCVATGAGFSVCVAPVPCNTNSDCAGLSQPGALFVCVEGGPAGHYCVNKASFNGANCGVSSDCPGTQECFRYSPYMVDQGYGECRVPCDGKMRCPVRGGVVHVCIGEGKGGCYPTGSGLPCADASDCLPELSCLAVSPDDRTLVKSPTICTVTCDTDDDCISNPFVGSGFCKENVCRMAGPATAPCDRPTQCNSGACVIDLDGQGHCGT